MADEIEGVINRLGGWRRIVTALVGIGAVGLIVAVSRWATAPAWVPVVSGVPIESTGELTDRLDRAGITNQLGRGGSEVLVQATDVARARVLLARDGIPTGGRPGLELFDKPAYAMTDFTQRVQYRRALEGELERTIGKMRGIASAQVHLAIHETSAFRTQTPSEASVVLKLTGGTEPAADVVQGIAHLVASSVDGLESDQVTVVDDGGRLLSIPNETSSVASLTSRQLATQREVEDHLQDKVETLLSQMVGRGNARVQVSALLNFDRLERTTQVLDPEKQVAASEQKAEIVPGAQGGAGSTNSATTYENSRSTETFAGAVGTVNRLTVAVLVNDKQSGAGDSATFQKRTPDELQRIDALVRTAVGYDSARGDIVSVVSVPFAAPTVVATAPEPAPSIVQKVQANQSLILNVAALVFAFVIGFLSLRAIKSMAVPASRQLPASTAMVPVAAGGMMPHGHVLEEPMAPRMVPELAAMQANAETRNRVSATVTTQPDVAAKLMRSWLKDG